MTEPSLTGISGSIAGTTTTFSILVGHFDSWGVVRLSLKLTRSEFGEGHGEEVGIPSIGLTLTVHSCWTGF